MYVWFRAARLLATRRRRGSLPVPFGVSELAFRVLPGDVDVNRHVNNGRYLAIADLGRYDLFLRSGLMREAEKRGWVPMLSGVSTVFRRELRLWERFTLVSRFLTWDDTRFVGEHRFLKRNGETAAMLLTLGGIYDRRARRFVPATEVLAAVGVEVDAPDPGTLATTFLEDQQRLREAAREGA